MRKLTAALLAWLALAAGQASAFSWEGQYGLPPTREPKACALAQVYHQAGYLRSRGWEIRDPEVRVFRGSSWAAGTQVSLSSGLNARVDALAFEWLGDPVVVLSPNIEWGACWNRRHAHPWTWDDDSMEVVFHELLHQLWFDEGWVNAHDRRAVINYRRSILRAMPVRSDKPPSRRARRVV